MNGNAAGIDGSVGFDSTAPYTFDPNNRAVAGKVDFIGLAGHEVTEVMGRFGLGQAGTGSGQYGAIDFFRYTSPGVPDIVPENGAYFSIDGGTTRINTFNGTGGGDLSDWAGLTSDSYNALFSSGVELPVSSGDLTVMDVIGYDRVIPGDFNRDGKLSVADAQSMIGALSDLRRYETINGLTDGQLLQIGDLDGDGLVTNADIQSLISLLTTGVGNGSNNKSIPVPEPAFAVLLAQALSVISLTTQTLNRKLLARSDKNLPTRENRK
jgi:hypothetical protein